MADAVDVHVTINGRPATLGAGATTSLATMLRDARYVGTKVACAEGRCGSCTVDLDGHAVYSCLVPAVLADGAAVTTIEAGVAPDLAEALRRHGAVQCGFCTPGFVMSVEHLLARTDDAPADEATVRAALVGNVCRCTGYEGIVAATLEVDRRRRASEPERASS